MLKISKSALTEQKFNVPLLDHLNFEGKCSPQFRFCNLLFLGLMKDFPFGHMKINTYAEYPLPSHVIDRISLRVKRGVDKISNFDLNVEKKIL